MSTARSAYARRGRRRSVGTTTRSRLGARSASPASALTEPSRRCDEESRRRGDVTRDTTAHTTRRARVSTARSAHARRGRRRSVGTANRSRLGTRSASPVSALTEPSAPEGDAQQIKSHPLPPSSSSFFDWQPRAQGRERELILSGAACLVGFAVKLYSQSLPKRALSSVVACHFRLGILSLPKKVPLGILHKSTNRSYVRGWLITPGLCDHAATCALRRSAALRCFRRAVLQIGFIPRRRMTHASGPCRRHHHDRHRRPKLLCCQ